MDPLLLWWMAAQAAAAPVLPDIEFVGANVNIPSIGGTSVTIPTHQAGDFLIFHAFRDGDETTPSLASGATNIATQTALTNLQSRFGYKVAASSSETSGTWANADNVAVLVYRNVGGVGASAGADSGDANPPPVVYPSLSLSVGNGSSTVVLFGTSRGTDAAYDTDVPSGFTNRFRGGRNAGGRFGAHSKAGVSSFAGISQNPTGTNRWYAFSLELLKATS